MSLVFKPFAIAAGFLAGFIGEKLFDRVWSLIDQEDAPDPQYRELPLGKLIAALVVRGAIFGVLRGLADHAARRGFARLTGEWPGDERPEPT
ncbi:MAG TPA: DUF4235 domain-containing protein [Solirubrobacteraceae bacterium]|jgi:hypothetical protein